MPSKKEVSASEEKAVKKTPAKKATTKKAATAKKAVEKKAAPAKKAAPKKTTTAKKTVETKVEEPTKKAPAKKTVTKKTTTAKKAVEAKVEEPAKKTATKKTTAAKKEVEAKVKESAKKAAPAKKKATATKKAVEVKEEAPAKKAPAKKATPKKTTKAVKVEQYKNFSLDTLIDMAKAMGVDYGYDQYANALLDSDSKTIAKEIIANFDLKAKKFSYDEDGYDTDLFEVLLNKISETVDIKASDFNTIEKDAKTVLKFELSDDATSNNDEYHKEFDLVKKILMIAQRKDVHTTSDFEKAVKVDTKAVVEHYMDVAYSVLKNWQYDDVKYYENFIYAVISQFSDLHDALANRAMMDASDLYIIHGDYYLGDANYGYVIRENAIKDYIYYRYASVYYDIDREKARSIAQSSLQYVDERYDYYPKLIEILEN